MAAAAIVGLLALVSFLVGGNNAAVAAGTAVGSRVIRRNTGLLITCAGYLIGLLFEGSKLSRLRIELLPNSTDIAIILVMSVSVLIFVLADVFRTPASLTYAMVGSLVGLSLTLGNKPNLGYLGEMLLLWLLGPLVVLASSAQLARIIVRRRGNPWRRLPIYRVGIVVAVFFSAYALGANTLGAILSIIPSNGILELLVVGAGAVTGALILGRGSINRVGDELYALGYSSAFLSQAFGASVIELSTQAGIALSSSRIVTSSTLGVGLSRPMRILNPKTVYIFIAEWFAVPSVALALSFLLGRLIYV